MGIQPFPHRYSVTLADGQLRADPRTPIALGPPPQFGGSDHQWSPEELLVGATIECLWTTFLAYAKRDKLHVHDWYGWGVGVLDRGHPVPQFTSIDLDVEVVVDAGNEERARLLLERAEGNCIISNALKVPVTLRSTMRTAPAQVSA